MIVALVLLQLLVVAMTTGGSRDQDLTARRLEATRAMYAAESVANIAVREFVNNTDEDGNGTVGGVASAGTPLAVAGGSAWASISASVAGSVTTGTITVTGGNGLAARKATATLARTAASSGTPGFYTEVWESASSFSNLSTLTWTSTPTWIGISPQLYYTSITDRARWPGQQATNWRQRWLGKITLPAGTHGFAVQSDDASSLLLGGTVMAAYNTPRGCATTSATAALIGGTYDFEGRYFENTGGHCLSMQWRLNNTGAWATLNSTNVSSTPTVAVAPIALSGVATIDGDGTPTGSSVDAFNSRNGAYGGANILTNQTVLSTNAASVKSIWLTNGSTIQGNVQSGPAANPSAVSLNQSSVVTGSQSYLTWKVALPEYNEQSTQPSSSGVFSGSGTTTLSSNVRYTSFTLSGAAASLTISGNVTLFCDGAFTLSGGARILVPNGSTLRLVVGGNVSVTNNSQINMTTGIPGSCRLFINAGNTARTITIQDSAAVCADIWATWCTMNLNGTAVAGNDFYGTFRGSALNMTGKARFHADVAAVGGTSSATTRLTSWAQVSP